MMTIKKTVGYAIQVNGIEDMLYKLRIVIDTQCKLKGVIPVHPREYLCSNCHYDKCDPWKYTHPSMIGKTMDAISVYFKGIRFCRGFELLWNEEFGRRFNRLNKKREYGFYVVVVRTMAVMIISLLIFIWLLQKVILHMRKSCVVLLQKSKLKHVNFTI